MARNYNVLKADEFGRELNRAVKQISFAMSVALNETGNQIQRDQVERMHQIFTVRRPSFIGRPESAHRSAIKRTRKATKQDPVVELAVLPPGGRSRADIVARHEADTTRRPQGGRSLAIPVEARRGKRDLVPKRFRPKELDFEPHGSSGRVFRGKERTFLIRNSRGGTIYQRTGRRRGGRRRRRGSGGVRGWNAGTRVLFRLRGTVRLNPQLTFFPIASRRFQRSFPANFRKAFEKALATAR